MQRANADASQRPWRGPARSSPCRAARRYTRRRPPITRLNNAISLENTRPRYSSGVAICSNAVLKTHATKLSDVRQQYHQHGKGEDSDPFQRQVPEGRDGKCGADCMSQEAHDESPPSLRATIGPIAVPTPREARSRPMLSEASRPSGKTSLARTVITSIVPPISVCAVLMQA